MTPEPAFAVLIVAYRSADLLEKCLFSVIEYLPECPVYVWDNSGSGISDVRTLAARFPEFRWHFSDQNLGFAAAVNRLAAMAPEHDLLVLNADAELLETPVETMSAIRQPNVAAAGPMLGDYSEDLQHSDRRVGFWHRTPTPWDVAYRKLTFLNALSGAAGLGERFRETPVSFKYRIQPTNVDGFIAGCSVAIRREAWDRIGPFDEEFFLYQEEAEWQLRAITAGWQVRLANEVAVRHIGRGTVSGDSERSQRSEDLAFANAILMAEYSFGRRRAEFFLAWWSLIEKIKHRVRRRRRPAIRRPDILITADGSPEEVANRIETASVLAGAGYSVAVVSLQRLGTLQRDLPPSIRLVRCPWWWPSITPQKLPSVVVEGTTRKEHAFTRLLRMRPGTTVLSARDAAALPVKAKQSMLNENS